MKRHEALIPLSREHHGALLLAQVLKSDVPDYKGMPTLPAEKAAYALEAFNNTLQPHFKKEEMLMQKVMHLNERLDTLVAEILREHIELTEAFQHLNQSQNLERSLHLLGEKLSEHIRKEERVLFPLIEESCTTRLLNELKTLHE